MGSKLYNLYYFHLIRANTVENWGQVNPLIMNGGDPEMRWTHSKSRSQNGEIQSCGLTCSLTNLIPPKYHQPNFYDVYPPVFPYHALICPSVSSQSALLIVTSCSSISSYRRPSSAFNYLTLINYHLRIPFSQLFSFTDRKAVGNRVFHSSFYSVKVITMQRSSLFPLYAS